MNNYKLALEVIGGDRILARGLRDKGLIAPDLPEPVADDGGREWGDIVRREPDGSLHVMDDLYGERRSRDLRAYALALLAAANYAEENK